MLTHGRKVKSLKTPSRKFGTDITKSASRNSTRKDISAGIRNGKSLENSVSKAPFISPTRGIKSRFQLVGEKNNGDKSIGIHNSTPSTSIDRPSKKVIVRRSARKSSQKGVDPKIQRSLKKKENVPDSEFQTPNGKRIEYTIHFSPGPIGLKLEPVVRNTTSEIGCRVLKFVGSKKNEEPSQAQRSGKINIGDIFVSIDGTNIMSRSYSEIIEILRVSASSTKGRTITFRSVRNSNPKQVSPTENLNLDKSLSKQNLGHMAEFATSLTVKREEYKSPLVQVTTPSEKTSFHQNAILTPTDKNLTEPMNRTPRENLTKIFSPSFVKSISKTSINDESTVFASIEENKPLVNVLNTVIKSALPVAESVINSSTNMTNAFAKKFNEAITGTSAKEFNETARLKMILLRELSEAKAALGQIEDEKKQLQYDIDKLKDDHELVEKAKNEVEKDLKKVQEECVSTWQDPLTD